MYKGYHEMYCHIKSCLEFVCFFHNNVQKRHWIETLFKQDLSKPAFYGDSVY